MSEVAVSVRGLAKHYVIDTVRTRHDTLRDQLADGFERLLKRSANPQQRKRTIWALDGVSFEIKRGEVVGIVGRNGAGKSTLLKILSRITEPTRGSAEIRGRVGSLLEVGTGFHGELTGRENIYLNGAILGMRKKEIDRLLDAIVAFSGVEAFLDVPVKRYSSGMYLRLAFAVAAHLETEILMVDEVLAVGDAEFQKKCLGKMGEVARGGRTVLLVSHNMGSIVQLCDRALWIHDGSLKIDGPAPEVVASYLSSTAGGGSTWINADPPGPGETCWLSSAYLSSPEGRQRGIFEFRSPFHIVIEYEVLQRLQGLSMICRLTDAWGNIVCSSWESDTGEHWDHDRVREAGRYRAACKIPAALLRPGMYYVLVGAVMPGHKMPSHENVLVFEISEVGYHLAPGRKGIVTPLLEWESKALDGPRVAKPAAASHQTD